MGISHPHRLWLLGKAVSKNEKLADPRRYGQNLKYELEKYRTIMPVFMHEKRITFGNSQTKHSHTRRAFFPNVFYKALFSKALDMKIWSCVSSKALREIDARGGFDEYIVQVSKEKLGNDKVALMYKDRILKARAKGDSELDKKMNALLLDRFGIDYVEKLNKAQVAG